jgi:hypothetical protein
LIAIAPTFVTSVHAYFSAILLLRINTLFCAKRFAACVPQNAVNTIWNIASNAQKPADSAPRLATHTTSPLHKINLNSFKLFTDRTGKIYPVFFIYLRYESHYF